MGQICSDVASNKKWTFVKSECEKFTLENVLDARYRYSLVFKDNPSSCISRSMFWEIFTDYDPSHVRGGTFLNLPLEFFDLFKRRNDDYCDIREIFCLLAFLCKSSFLSARIEAIFPLFGCVMTEERVAQVLGCLNRTLTNLEVITEPASSKQIMVFASRLCGEGTWRKCKTVSSQLFGDWILNCDELAQVCSLFTSKTERRASQMCSLQRKRNEIQSSDSILKANAKKLLASSEKLTQKPIRKKSLKNNIDLENNTKDFVALQLEKKMRQAEKKKNREKEMMKKAREAGIYNVKNLKVQDIKKIKAKWATYTKNSDNKRYLSRDKFAELMSTEFPSFSDRHLAKQLFEAFDKNKDGFIGFPEFMLGTGRITSGTIKDKTDFLFEVLSDNSQYGGEVHDQESKAKIASIIKLVQSANREIVDCAHFVEVLLTMMDGDKNGSIDRKEFYLGLKEIPELLECFNECLRPSGKIKPFVLSLEKGIPDFNIKNLNQAWLSLSDQKHEYSFVDWHKFLKFMTSIWNGKNSESGNPSSNEMSLSDSSIHKLLLSLYRRADKSISNGEVDLRRTIVGIMDILMDKEDISSTEVDNQRAELYFNLFDVDGSGEVEYAEFFEMLYAAQLDLQDPSWQTLETLRVLDDNGDGMISKSDFIQAMKTNPIISDCFSRIFGASEEEDAESTHTHMPKHNQSGVEPDDENIQEETKLNYSSSAPELASKSTNIVASDAILRRVSSAVVLPLDAVYKTTYNFKETSPRLPVVKRVPSTVPGEK